MLSEKNNMNISYTCMHTHVFVVICEILLSCGKVWKTVRLQDLFSMRQAGRQAHTLQGSHSFVKVQSVQRIRLSFSCSRSFPCLQLFKKFSMLWNLRVCHRQCKLAIGSFSSAVSFHLCLGLPRDLFPSGFPHIL